MSAPPCRTARPSVPTPSRATAFCAPRITVLAQSAGAAVQKSISPAQSVRPQPGLPGQNIQVKFATQNTGTLWLKQLSCRTSTRRSSTPLTSGRPTRSGSTSRPAPTGSGSMPAPAPAADADFVTGTVDRQPEPGAAHPGRGCARHPGHLPHRGRQLHHQAGHELPGHRASAPEPASASTSRRGRSCARRPAPRSRPN